MRRALLVSTLVVSLFSCAVGQAAEPRLENGKVEDLVGVVKFVKLYRMANPHEQTGTARQPRPDTNAARGPAANLSKNAGADGRASNGSVDWIPEPPLEKGTFKDLRGTTRVYVGAGPGSAWLMLRVVAAIRKEIPQLTFVSLREDADVWLLISQDGEEPDADIFNTRPPPLGLKFRGKIVRFQRLGPPRLVKEMSEEWPDFPTKLARDFVAAHRKANRNVPADKAALRAIGAEPPSLGGTMASGDLLNSKPTLGGSGPEAVTEDDVVLVDTSLVTIHANVTGRDGRPAPTMRLEDFSIYEDDDKHEIAYFEPVERPFTVVLLIDVSGSVRPRLKSIAEAANALVNSLRNDDQIVCLTFDSEIREVLKLTMARDLRDKGIKISSAGGTRLYDAVDFVIAKYLRRLPGRKAVVMLTDGIDGSSFIAGPETNVRDAEELDALFYAVQYNTWVEPVKNAQGTTVEKLRKLWEESSNAYLQSLTQKTGGRLYLAHRTVDLAPAFASIVEELSRQYSLGYYPRRQPQDGERRRIKVRVNSPDLVVRARDSYVSKSREARPAAPK